MIVKENADSSFEAVVEEFADLVTRLCCFNLNDISQAEDCWQDVFLSLYSSPAILEKPITEIRKWLVTVTINKCRNLNKRLFHRRHENVDSLDIPVFDEHTGEVLDVLRGLSKKYSQVIYLHYCEGYSIQQGQLKMGFPSKLSATSWDIQQFN